MAAPAKDPKAENPPAEEQSNEDQADQKDDGQRIIAIPSDDKFDEQWELLKNEMVIIDFTATWYVSPRPINQ